MAPERERIIDETEIESGRDVQNGMETAQEDERSGQHLQRPGMAHELQIGATAALLKDAAQTSRPLDSLDVARAVCEAAAKKDVVEKREVAARPGRGEHL